MVVTPKLDLNVSVHVNEHSDLIPTTATSVIPTRFEAMISYPGKPYRVWLDIRTSPGAGPVIYDFRLQHSLTELKGITTDLLRNIKLRELRRLAVEAATTEVAITRLPDGYYRFPGETEDVMRFGAVHDAPGHGRSMNRDHLQEVVDVYREAVAAGSRKPVEVVRQTFDTSRSTTAGRWLVQAHKAGLLGPARGPVAGELQPPKERPRRPRKVGSE